MTIVGDAMFLKNTGIIKLGDIPNTSISSKYSNRCLTHRIHITWIIRVGDLFR